MSSGSKSSFEKIRLKRRTDCAQHRILGICLQYVTPVYEFRKKMITEKVDVEERI